MKVKVVSRFQHRDTGKYYDPGQVLSLKRDHAERLVAAGCVEILPSRKRKKPGEDKAKRATEDKGAGPIVSVP